MATERKYLSLEKLGLYDEKIKKVISDADAAALKSAKDYAKEYADSLADNYDAAGSATTAQSAAEAKAQELVNAEAAIARAAEQANATAAATAQAAAEAADAKAVKAQEEVDALELVVQNIQENAYDDTEVRGLISGLDTNKADKTQVATDIAAAVLVEENARKEAVAGVQGAVDTLSGTHATDKAALEAAIALKADQTALDAVSGVANAAATQVALTEEVNRAKGEEARIEGLVSAEVERATGIENGLKGRIETMEAFWAAAQADGTDSNVIDTLKEIQEYIAGDETGAAEMAASIKQNADDIDALEGKMGTAEGKISTLEGDMTQAKTDIDAVEAAVATKAEASVVTELSGKVTTAEGKIATLEGKMTAVEGAVATKVEQSAYNAKIEALEGVDAGFETRIAGLEEAVGSEGSVAELIEAAKNAAISTAAGDATSKANAAEAAAKKYTDDEIAELDLANTYAPKTHGHEMAEVTGLVDALAGKQAVGDYATKAEAQAMADGKDAAIAEAKKAGTDAAAALGEYQTTNDAAVKANADAIAAFVEISEAEINALFQN